MHEVVQPLFQGFGVVDWCQEPWFTPHPTIPDDDTPTRQHIVDVFVDLGSVHKQL